MRGLATGFSALARAACRRAGGSTSGPMISPAGKGHPGRVPGFAVPCLFAQGSGHGAAPADVTFARFPGRVSPGSGLSRGRLPFRPPCGGLTRPFPRDAGKGADIVRNVLIGMHRRAPCRSLRTGSAAAGSPDRPHSVEILPGCSSPWRTFRRGPSSRERSCRVGLPAGLKNRFEGEIFALQSGVWPDCCGVLSPPR